MYKYTEFPGEISREEIYNIAPGTLHIVGIAVMLLWTLIVLLSRHQYAAVRARYKRVFWTVGLLVGIGLGAILYFAFADRSITGYQEGSEWEWLDSIYYAIPIYNGEWAGLLFIYLIPLIFFILYCMAFVHRRLREYFISQSLLYYGRVILLAYIVAGITIMVTGTSLEKPKYTNSNPEQPF